MNLTFKGFLRGYCRELTGLSTDSLRKLCSCVDKTCPAAAEALMVFAAVQGKAAYLEALSRDTWMHQSYSEFATQLNAYSSVEEYLRTSQVPQRYAKVWLAYQSKKNAIVADRRVVLLMRDKTLDAMMTAETTAYRLCKDLV